MWVYAYNGQKIGPVEFDEIVNQINAGVIVQNTPVRCSGEKTCRAGEHPKLKPYFITVNSSSATQTSAFESVNSSSETAIPDFSQLPTSNSSSGHKKTKRRISGNRKKSANSNQMLIIGLAVAAIVVIGLGVFIVGSGGSGSSTSSNFFANKVPKTVRFSDEDTVDNLLPKAESGNMEAQFKLAMSLRPHKNTEEVLKWLNKSSESGYAPAQFFNYFYNKIYEIDNTKAEQCLKKAADQNYPSAKAFCYVEGIGVEPNKYKPEKILKEAAENGDSIAQFCLGLYYHEGGFPGILDRKLDKDMDKAKYWLRQSAEQGFPIAQGILYQEYNDKKWGNIIAKRSDVDFQVFYAVKVVNDFLLNMNTNSEDQAEFDEAIAMLKNGAQKDNADAQYMLGRLYFHGVSGFPENKETAYTWLKKAENNGNSDARRFIKENFSYRGNF